MVAFCFAKEQFFRGEEQLPPAKAPLHLPQLFPLLLAQARSGLEGEGSKGYENENEQFDKVG